MATPTIAFSSQGSKLQVSISAVDTDILQIRGLTGPSVNWDIADITNLNSPGNFKEKLPLMKDPGKVTFTLIYDPANAAHEYLRASNAAEFGTLEAFKEIINSATPKTIGFSAYVTKFQFKLETNKPGEVDVELTLTGAITFS